MTTNRYMHLRQRQQATLLVAAQIRNAMEDFHARHLDDSQMAELNPIIRQAVYDPLTTIGDGLDSAHGSFDYLLSMIPKISAGNSTSWLRQRFEAAAGSEDAVINDDAERRATPVADRSRGRHG